MVRRSANEGSISRRKTDSEQLGIQYFPGFLPGRFHPHVAGATLGCPLRFSKNYGKMVVRNEVCAFPPTEAVRSRPRASESTARGPAPTVASCPSMQLNDAKSQRVTVKQAADLLGATPEAVRARLFRGTLEREGGDRGIVHVRLHANQLRSRADQAGAQSPLAPYLLERMLDEIAHPRRRLYEADKRDRENRRIIAALTRGIPGLPPPAQEELSPQQRPSHTQQYAVTPTPQPKRERCRHRSKALSRIGASPCSLPGGESYSGVCSSR
jgi:hypothetical protein